jgi:large subunit ribosomal protein L18
MADKNIAKNKRAERRRRRVRSKVFGTTERPRLTVDKSLKNIRVQIVDDVKHVTVIGLASDSKVVRDLVSSDDSKTVVARKVGIKLAEEAKAKGIEQVVFDRNRYQFHGRVKAVADGAHEGGLKF